MIKSINNAELKNTVEMSMKIPMQLRSLRCVRERERERYKRWIEADKGKIFSVLVVCQFQIGNKSPIIFFQRVENTALHCAHCESS